jgi:hypothetical protein
MRVDPTRTEDYRGFRISIYPDSECWNPREDRDNFGTMVCFHKRYALGDKHDLRHSDFTSWDSMQRHLEKEIGALIVLPLYLYDHSGLRIKIGGFQGLLPQGHAEFDSGQVGFIYCTSENIRENWGVKQITKARLEHAEKLLRGEVSEYDDYLCGNCYGYEITEVEEKGTDIDKEAVWGFLGDSKPVMDEAKSVVDYYWKNKNKKEASAA